MGFFPISKGEIAFRRDSEGSALNFLSLEKDPSLKQMIGFSTQEPSFYDKLTINENLEYFAKLYNIPDQFIKQRIAKIIELVELTGEENTLAGELSGGMKKRLDIACSLINDPKILILDEPTADLDPLLRQHIWKLLKKINSLGKTIIVSSHFLEEMDVLCHRIGIIYNKTIAHIGTADDLRKNYSYDKEIIVDIESKNYQRLASLLKGLPITKIVVKDNRMHIRTKQAESVLKKVVDILEKSKENVLELEIHRPSLDDVFVSVINGAQ
jgi:ABC-2 type transport system ATP-binding protein